MKPTITVFKESPDRGRGLARDMRVRWALEEVGQPYDVRLVTFKELDEPAHLARHPFGQIPTYEEGDLTLFESGAIVLHVAERHPGLLPADANARARAISWMFAALNTVEPPIVNLSAARLLEDDKPWYEERLPMLKDSIRETLGDLSRRLGDADWLDGAFSAGDLLMVTVLRRLERSGLLEEFPNLLAYVARGAARPAYKRAFADQLAIFTGNLPMKTVHIDWFLDTPLERAWQAWTNPVFVRQWWGSDPKGEVLAADLDVRPGGRFSIRFKDSDQSEHTCFGTYTEVERLSRLSFNWFWKSEPDHQSFVTVQFMPEGQGTRMRFEHRDLPPSSMHDHDRGWRGGFAKLERALTDGAKRS